MLQELTVKYKSDSDHSLLDVSTFPFAKALTLKVPREDYRTDDLAISTAKMSIIASQIAKMPRMQSLDLRDFNAKFIGIISNHEATNRRTKTLCAALWEDPEEGNGAEPYHRFMMAISCFKHIEFLKLWIHNGDLHLDDNFERKSLMESCSNLKGLDFDDDGLGIEYEMLQAIGHRLQYLVLHDHLERIVDSTHENQIVFKNMRELQQGYVCSDASIRKVLETSINLEKVKLSHGAQKLVEEILIKCERLRV